MAAGRKFVSVDIESRSSPPSIRQRPDLLFKRSWESRSTGGSYGRGLACEVSHRTTDIPQKRFCELSNVIASEVLMRENVGLSDAVDDSE